MVVGTQSSKLMRTWDFSFYRLRACLGIISIND
jgi:hypothetical protein